MRRCAGKKRYETSSKADGARTSICNSYALERSQLDVYRCDQCLGYHVGHSKNFYISRKRRSGKRANKRLRGRV